jgi:hypothetical protein
MFMLILVLSAPTAGALFGLIAAFRAVQTVPVSFPIFS